MGLLENHLFLQYDISSKIIRYFGWQKSFIQPITVLYYTAVDHYNSSKCSNNTVNATVSSFDYTFAFNLPPKMAKSTNTCCDVTFKSPISKISKYFCQMKTSQNKIVAHCFWGFEVFWARLWTGNISEGILCSLIDTVPHKLWLNQCTYNQGNHDDLVLLLVQLTPWIKKYSCRVIVEALVSILGSIL